MPLSTLTDAIKQQVPLVVLSPHLDDAVLSCGALMMYAVSSTTVTVATIFTEAGRVPHTLSARRYLHQVGAANARSLYQQRRAEDEEALASVGARYVHAGLTEALFRRRTVRAGRSLLARWLPEADHVYPVYRKHITAGRIAAADAGTLHDVCGIIRQLTGSGPSLVLAPLGVGGHVDHVLVRDAAERSDAPVVYYSDFPYNRQHGPDDTFLRQNHLSETSWPESAEIKTDLIRMYRTQIGTLFHSGHIPRAPEVFFSRP